MKNSFPTVDVIIPAYNASRFIRETIQSVLDQTLLPRKIIVVNDASTDDTVEIVGNFESELIELISVEHGGVSRARNIGIKASEADYIAFLDADDVWASSKLEAQLRQLGQNHAAAVCYSDAQIIDEHGAVLENGYGYGNAPYVRGQVFEDILLYERPIRGSASSVIVSKDVLLKTKLFDESMQFSEDVNLWADLALLTEFDCVKEPHVKIRHHSTSTTRQKNWKKSKRILLQHFYYINKFSNQYQLPMETIRVHNLRIIYLFLEHPKKIGEIFSLYYSLKRTAPSLIKQMKFHNLVFFIANISLEVFKRALPQAHPLKRLKLLFSKGTIFFGKH